jgi:signal transduction histidine kinase
VGIGLYLVKMIVEAHNGRIQLVSDGAGKGSAFVVRIPVVNA